MISEDRLSHILREEDRATQLNLDKEELGREI